MTHTPGPWELYHRGPQPEITFDHSEAYRVAGANDATICYVPRDCQQDDDNVRLIAAAPDLLRACEIARGVIQLRNEEIDGDICNGDVFAFEKLSAAIAKATGKD